MQMTEALSEGLKRGSPVAAPANDLEACRQAKLSDLARDFAAQHDRQTDPPRRERAP